MTQNSSQFLEVVEVSDVLYDFTDGPDKTCQVFFSVEVKSFASNPSNIFCNGDIQNRRWFGEFTHIFTFFLRPTSSCVTLLYSKSSYPIVSMGLVYLPLFTYIFPKKTTIHVSKHTSPMDCMGTDTVTDNHSWLRCLGGTGTWSWTGGASKKRGVHHLPSEWRKCHGTKLRNIFLGGRWNESWRG